MADFLAGIHEDMTRAAERWRGELSDRRDAAR
jgi:hypothetical protein